MRRFFVLVLILAITLGIVACGGDEPAEAQAQEAAADSDERSGP